MIAKPQYHSGIGWNAKFSESLDLIPEQYRSKVCSEAQISINMDGGRPSSAHHRELCRVIDALNAGREPEFPRVEWNREQIAKERLTRW